MVCLFEGPMTTTYTKANTKQYQQIECSSIFNVKVCMLITYDAEEKKKLILIYFSCPPLIVSVISMTQTLMFIKLLV